MFCCRVSLQEVSKGVEVAIDCRYIGPTRNPFCCETHLYEASQRQSERLPECEVGVALLRLRFVVSHAPHSWTCEVSNNPRLLLRIQLRDSHHSQIRCIHVIQMFGDPGSGLFRIRFNPVDCICHGRDLSHLFNVVYSYNISTSFYSSHNTSSTAPDTISRLINSGELPNEFLP